MAVHKGICEDPGPTINIVLLFSEVSCTFPQAVASRCEGHVKSPRPEAEHICSNQVLIVPISK